MRVRIFSSDTFIGPKKGGRRRVRPGPAPSPLMGDRSSSKFFKNGKVGGRSGSDLSTYAIESVS